MASIVSDDCRHSPFGLIIHTDHPSGIYPTDISLQYPNLFERKKRATAPEKNHFGNASLAKEEPIEKEIPFQLVFSLLSFLRGYQYFEHRKSDFFSMSECICHLTRTWYNREGSLNMMTWECWQILC